MKTDQQNKKKLFSISVIIPTKDRPQSLLRAVRSIACQNVLPKEIIIVDQSSAPSKEAEFENFFTSKKKTVKIKLLSCPNLSGLTAARNAGFSVSSGELIQFLDDDSVLEKKYFENVLKYFSASEIDGLCGRIIEPKKRFHPLAKYFQKIVYLGPYRQIREEWYHENKPEAKITNILPGVAMYRRHVLEKITFDENLTGGCLGEDVEFSFRASRENTFLLVPRPKIRHLPDPRGRAQGKQQAFLKVLFYKYHSKKNIPQTCQNKLLFLILLIGFIFHSIVSLECGRLIGTLKGVFSSRRIGFQ